MANDAVSVAAQAIYKASGLVKPWEKIGIDQDYYLHAARAAIDSMHLPEAGDFSAAAVAITYWSQADDCDDTDNNIQFLRGLARRMATFGCRLAEAASNVTAEGMT